MSAILSAVSLPYPETQEGFWGKPTSTINWCEEDYVVSYFAAEAVNTLTNLLFIAIGVRGVYNCIRFNYDTAFLVAYCGYLLVGCGSFAFHASLTYPMQLLDELSMIYTTSILCYTTFSLSQSTLFSLALGFSLTLLSLFITAYYHYVQEPLFHQVAFVFLFFTTLLRAFYTMRTSLRPLLKEKYRNQARENQIAKVTTQNKIPRDQAIIQEMWWMVVAGVITTAAGVVMWNLDNLYCDDFRRWRNLIGMPWGFVLEGHGVRKHLFLYLIFS
ncbi:alkaline ceramidase [Colletotrichum tofieldiae]|uniref:Alkaline ceramidase n=1 Tax=Colletotrichum tofieldiae TaxID=708197 RepID=A0A161VWA7_9PEZI|nr:alkaline ceramidase [Colletotrichum tofieldiae]